MAAAITFGSLTALAQSPDIATIMSRVAENQAASIEARKQFVFDEEQHVRLHRSNGKLAREETRLYAVTPHEADSERQLVKTEGRYADGAKLVAYDKPGVEHGKEDIDAALMQSFFEDEPGDNNDGIPKELFPLTLKEQGKYAFTLEGIETFHGRTVFRVRFAPKKTHPDGDGGDWKGEALIDALEFQPVMVSTDLAWKVPMAVRTLLGTDLRGVGFSVTYQPFADHVWFPVTYGGEFAVRGLFFYKRTISLELVHKNFRHADVASKVAFEDSDPVKPEPSKRDK